MVHPLRRPGIARLLLCLALAARFVAPLAAEQFAVVPEREAVEQGETEPARLIEGQQALHAPKRRCPIRRMIGLAARPEPRPFAGLVLTRLPSPTPDPSLASRAPAVVPLRV